jgi:nucleotide-binding universal stress UspA family protein
MAFVAGYSPQESGTAALELATVLARSTGQELVVAVVVASPHLTLDPDVDEASVKVLTAWGEAALERARATMPDDVRGRFVVRHARSIPAGLDEVVAEHDGTALVLGSSDKGHLGRISLGSITGRMMHGAGVPLAVAPRGYRGDPGARIVRVTVAYDGADGAAHLLDAAWRWAAEIGAALRAVSFAVQTTPVLVPMGVAPETEDLVTQQAVRRWRDSLASDLAGLEPHGDLRPGPLEVGAGSSWRDALESVDWVRGDLLVVGSSSSAPATRVFLGSRASKILRHAPVPVMVVPAA